MRVAQCILFSLLFASITVCFGGQFNLTPGVTPISHAIFDLHMTIFWICVAIGVIVFGVMFYAILHHRKSQGAEAAQFHEHLWVELAWSIIPLIILVVMAVPATRVLMQIRDASLADVTIKITGHQWKWQYEYLGSGVRFFSNNATPFAEIHGDKPKNENYLRTVDHPLVIPIHKKIRFLLTSNDVIHSWWMPDFGVKQDAVPGYIVESWARVNRAGTYHGQCSELCGMNHAYMPIVVVAMAEKDFDQWLLQQQGGAPAAVPVAASTSATKAAASLSTLATSATPAVASPSTSATSATTATTNPSTPAAATPSSSNAAKAPSAPASSATAATPGATATPAGALSLQQQMQKGADVYNNTCAVCHMPTGEGMPPTYPALKGDKFTTGPLPLHLNRVLFGKSGTAMQAFKDQLTDDEIAAVVTYERNAWGNAKGDVVQSADVKAARDKGPLAE